MHYFLKEVARLLSLSIHARSAKRVETGATFLIRAPELLRTCCNETDRPGSVNWPRPGLRCVAADSDGSSRSNDLAVKHLIKFFSSALIFKCHLSNKNITQSFMIVNRIRRSRQQLKPAWPWPWPWSLPAPWAGHMTRVDRAESQTSR